MREKLIELLVKAHNAVTDKSLENDSEFGMTYAEQIETEADSLIANGFTIPVRCKDCIWFDLEDELPDVFRSEQYCYCTEANTYVPINHFCSFGERRTDD